MSQNDVTQISILLLLFFNNEMDNINIDIILINLYQRDYFIKYFILY